MTTHRIGDVTVLHDEIPGIGFLPVKAYLLHAQQPVVVDTGLGLPGRDFAGALCEVIDPAEVRWIWLTHPDRDHTGGLFALLDAAPQDRLVTTFTGVGIMSTDAARRAAPDHAVVSSQTGTVVPANGYVSLTPVWSPDSTRLLFNRENQNGRGPTSLWTANTDGSSLSKLAYTASLALYQWGPHRLGSRLGELSSLGGQFQIVP
jgi:Metallo-beta-lactamase superfamily